VSPARREGLAESRNSRIDSRAELGTIARLRSCPRISAVGWGVLLNFAHRVEVQLSSDSVGYSSKRSEDGAR